MMRHLRRDGTFMTHEETLPMKRKGKITEINGNQTWHLLVTLI